MNLLRLLTAAALTTGGVSMAQAASVTVNATADLYNATGVVYEGIAPTAIDVTGLSSISFAVSAGPTVTLNSGGNYNDADGVGAAVPSSSNSGSSTISGITAPGAGYIAGVFLSASPSASVPTAISFTAPGATSFASLFPLLQQAFFVGDGLTGDASGAVQTFYVPTGATTLYLGLADACGYNGSSGCYGDNAGSFAVTTTGVGTPTSPVSAVPEPDVYAMMFGGLGLIGFVARRRKA